MWSQFDPAIGRFPQVGPYPPWTLAFVDSTEPAGSDRLTRAGRKGKQVRRQTGRLLNACWIR